MSQNKRNLRHGAWLFLRRGQMPEGCDELRRGIAKLHADLADEYAGPGATLTASQVVLIARVCQLTAFLKLAEREVWKKGPIGADVAGSPEVVPALSKFYIAATNGVAKALRTLQQVSGRIESGKQTPDLKAYLLAKPEKTTVTPVRKVQKFSDDEPVASAPGEASPTDSAD